MKVNAGRRTNETGTTNLPVSQPASQPANPRHGYDRRSTAAPAGARSHLHLRQQLRPAATSTRRPTPLTVGLTPRHTQGDQGHKGAQQHRDRAAAQFPPPGPIVRTRLTPTGEDAETLSDPIRRPLGEGTCGWFSAIFPPGPRQIAVLGGQQHRLAG